MKVVGSFLITQDETKKLTAVLASDLTGYRIENKNLEVHTPYTTLKSPITDVKEHLQCLKTLSDITQKNQTELYLNETGSSKQDDVLIVIVDPTKTRIVVNDTKIQSISFFESELIKATGVTLQTVIQLKQNRPYVYLITGKKVPPEEFFCSLFNPPKDQIQMINGFPTFVYQILEENNSSSE